MEGVPVERVYEQVDIKWMGLYFFKLGHALHQSCVTVHSLLTSTAVDPLGFTGDSFTGWEVRTPGRASRSTPAADARQLADNEHLLDDIDNRAIYLVEFSYVPLTMCTMKFIQWD